MPTVSPARSSLPLRMARRLLRLHGDAVGNARGAVLRDEAAKRRRESTLAEIRDIRSREGHL
ncbi:MAG: hypothetical protein ACJ735_17000 [Actinomycetes bacterium]